MVKTRALVCVFYDENEPYFRTRSVGGMGHVLNRGGDALVSVGIDEWQFFLKLL